MGIITLTTDFGLKDPYQGAMKGAILSVNPKARIFDITHLVSAGGIIEGALIMSAACRFFPAGTIHVGVVDPGVGGFRRAILVETERYVFVGPDNGLLSLALEGENIKRAIELTDKRYFLSEVSNTFHGRDIFGPVAAHLTLGVSPALFGPPFERPASVSLPQPSVRGGVVNGVVIYADSFGNLITNIKRDLLGRGREDAEVSVKGAVIKGIKKTYSSAPEGALVALFGSSGFLEIAVNNGSAAAKLGAAAQDGVTVR